MNKLILAGALTMALGGPALAGDDKAHDMKLTTDATVYVFTSLDTDDDLLLTREEVEHVDSFDRTFDILDADGDGNLDLEESLVIMTWGDESSDGFPLYDELTVRYGELTDGHDAMAMRLNDTSDLKPDHGIDKYDSDWAKTRDDIDVEEDDTES